MGRGAMTSHPSGFRADAMSSRPYLPMRAQKSRARGAAWIGVLNHPLPIIVRAAFSNLRSQKKAHWTDR